MKIRLDGAKELRAALKAASDDVRDAASKAVVGAAVELRGDIAQSVNRGPASGITYYRIPGAKYMTVRAGSQDGPPVAFIPGAGSHNLDRVHKASAPGQAPMTDTGRLANSIEFDVEGQLAATVSTLVEYAEWLEYGTSLMKPRPFFRPAVKRMRPRFNKLLEAAISGALK